MFTATVARWSPLAALLVLAISYAAGGCAGATVKPTIAAARDLPKPDFVVVCNFAVTPNEVSLDRGVLATAVRESGARSVTYEERQVGHLVSDRLAEALVADLRAAGINAVRNSYKVMPSATTAFIYGQFLTVDQGNQTARVWVGFGLGDSQLRTRVHVVQGGSLVAQADTATTSGLKPGMLASMGAGTAVAGAASTGVSEAFLATIEADARRTSKEIARQIGQGYEKRGWK